MGTVGAPTFSASFVQETDSNGNPNGILDVSVNATAQVPTYFMRIFLATSLCLCRRRAPPAAAGWS